MNHWENDKYMLPTIKRLGYTDWWSKYRTGGSYETAKTIGKYKVEIEEDEFYPNIFIWNPVRPCVMISINKHDRIGILSRFLHSPTCTIDGKMKHGEDTREMLNMAFNIAKEYGVEKIQLTDVSTVDCNGVKADLSVYNLFTFGKTWYEKRFNFYPIDSYGADFQEDRKKLPILNNPCDYYTKENTYNLLKKYNIRYFQSIVWEKKL